MDQHCGTRRKNPSRTLIAQTIVAGFRGNYRKIDLSGNFVLEEDVNLSTLAKQLGCLKPWEELDL